MMFASMALLGSLAVGTAGAPDVSIDVFLVAGNATHVQDLGWLKDAQNPGSIQSLLAEGVAPFVKAKSPFLVIDGGDCSVFPADGKRSVAISHREYEAYDSMTESVTTGKVTKTKVLARTESEMTTSTVLEPRPYKSGHGYCAQTFLYVRNNGKSDPLASLQDLNSYETAVRDDKQDQVWMDKTFAITADSVETTKAFLANHPEFNGICLCPWGLKDKAASNIVSFPPAGVVGHYKFFRRDGKWGAELVEYAGLKDTLSARQAMAKSR